MRGRRPGGGTAVARLPWCNVARCTKCFTMSLGNLARGAEVVMREIPHFKGELITPDDASYDRVRTVWNAMHDRRPRLIARCVDLDDVVAALAYSRAHALPIAVRGAGHSIPGHGDVDAGLGVGLGRVDNVQVDPVAPRPLFAGRGRPRD